jgi:hypothetical protein
VVDDHARAGDGVGLLGKPLAIADQDERAAVAGALVLDLYCFQGWRLPGTTGATGLGFFGFFFSRLLFCWPLGMALLYTPQRVEARFPRTRNPPATAAAKNSAGMLKAAGVAAVRNIGAITLPPKSPPAAPMIAEIITPRSSLNLR